MTDQTPTPSEPHAELADLIASLRAEADCASRAGQTEALHHIATRIERVTLAAVSAAAPGERETWRVETPWDFDRFAENVCVALIERDDMPHHPVTVWTNEDGDWFGIRPVSEDDGPWTLLPDGTRKTGAVPVSGIAPDDDFMPFTVLWADALAARPAPVVSGEAVHPMIALAEDIEFYQAFVADYGRRVDDQYRADRKRADAILAKWKRPVEGFPNGLPLAGIDFYPSSAESFRLLAEHYPLTVADAPEAGGRAPWEHEGHKPVQHRDRKAPWCDTCGWSSPAGPFPAAMLGEPRTPAADDEGGRE